VLHSIEAEHSNTNNTVRKRRQTLQVYTCVVKRDLSVLCGWALIDFIAAWWVTCLVGRARARVRVRSVYMYTADANNLTTKY
jgi:hypothetical protein